MFLEVLFAAPLVIFIFRKLWAHLNRTYFILSLCKRIRTEDGSLLESKIYVAPSKTRFGNNFDLVNFTSGK